MSNKAIVFLGFGYTAQFAAKLFKQDGYTIFGTSRNVQKSLSADLDYVNLIKFNNDSNSDFKKIINEAHHIIVSVPPIIDFFGNSTTDGNLYARAVLKSSRTSEYAAVLRSASPTNSPPLASFRRSLMQSGAYVDPSLSLLSSCIENCKGSLRSITYLSSTGVYGDHQGGWVDEDTNPAPDNLRNQARLDAEMAWNSLADRLKIPLRIFRLAGIYGPGGRNALERIKTGNVKSVFKEGQVFCRIHVEDIANILHRTITQKPSEEGVFNLADDYPCSVVEVNKYAASLLGLPEPKIVDITAAELSEMAKEFYSACKRVKNDKIKKLLGIDLIYPTYKEGLDKIYQDNFKI